MLSINKKVVIKRKRSLYEREKNMKKKEYNNVKILSIIDSRASASPKSAT
jgi:hypothetical protein